jgi:hypothetical protein
MLLLQPLPANLKAVSQHHITDLISTLFIPFLLFYLLIILPDEGRNIQRRLWKSDGPAQLLLILFI